MANEPNYSSNPSKDEPKKEKVRVIPLEYIYEFPGHPFKVLDDESMQKLMNSIEEIGVQSPIVARIKEDQRYEIISGHRRVHACRKLGLKLIPAIVRDLSRDEAIIAMVDANLQREHILPSEKAAAYKMKMEAMKRQGKRIEASSAPMVQKLGEQTTRAIIGAESGDSYEQVRRFVRLNELVPELLEMVDRESIAFRPAVELSYLSEDEQRNLVETIDSEEATPSLSQAIRMKKLSQEGKLDMDKIFSIMTEEKPNQAETVKFKSDELSRFFPERTPPELWYVKVITTTTGDSVDSDRKTDATQAITITLLASPDQAKLLAYLNTTTTLHFSLVCRGDKTVAEQYLKVQEDYLASHSSETTSQEDTNG